MAAETYALVESAAALRFAQERLPEARVTTMSPYVTELLRQAGAEPLIADQLLTAAEADAIGYAAIAAAKHAAAAIDAAGAWPLGVKPGTALLFDLTAFAYKAAILIRLRAQIGADARLCIIGKAEPAKVEGFSVQAGRFDTLFAVFAAAGSGEVVPFDTPIPAGAQTNGDFAQTAQWTRAVTFMNAPATTIFNRLLKRVARAKPRRFRLGGADLVAGVFSSNELVEETALALAKAGARVMALPKYPSVKPQFVPLAAGAEIARVVADAIDAAFAHAGLGGSAMRLVAEIVGTHSAAALGRVAALAVDAEAYATRLPALVKGRPFTVLANAMSAPPLQILCQRLTARGIRYYVFEHGTGPGLDHNHDALYRAGMAPIADGAVYYNAHQREAHAKARGVVAGQGIVAGAPASMCRVGFRPIQRAMARSRVGAGSKRIVTWLTGLYPNNMPFQPHYYRDGSYHALRREIVYGVLGKLPDDVRLKLYPTMRHPDPDPFAGLMQLPANCRSVHLIDFRNVRAAADVLILDEPGSALAWCWGTGVPLIYLDTELH
jgi:hypothetical protein